MDLSRHCCSTATLLLLAACAGPTALVISSPPGARVVREVTSGGSGATVVQRAEPLGVTPLRMAYSWNRVGLGGGQRLLLEKDGYKPQVRSLERADSAPQISIVLDEANYTELWTPLIEFSDEPGYRYRFLKTKAFAETGEGEGAVADQIIAADGKGGAFFSSLHVVPDGTSLLFSRHEVELDAEGNPHCEVANLYRKPLGLDSLPEVRITDGFINVDPCSSPDGRWIYMASNRQGGQFDIIRIPSQPPLSFTLVHHGEANDIEPAFGPRESANLTFTSYPRRFSEPRLWTIGLNHQDWPTELRSGRSPAVSPDGAHIVYIGPDDHLWKMTSSGNHQTQLIAGPTTHEADPCWSPDGKWLVFVSDRGADKWGYRNNDIWVYSLERGKTTQLTVNGSDDRSPVFSADGRHVFFVSNRGLNWGVWRIPFDPDRMISNMD